MHGSRCLAFILSVFMACPAFAEEDDWGEGGWEELDEGTDKEREEQAERAMMMGTHTLPAGRFGFRASAGVSYLNVGAQAGVHDWVDVIAETYMPYKDLGNTWLVGGGAKVRLYGHGIWAYAFKLKAYGIFYSDLNDDVKNLPEGLALWPSFMIGMKIKQGCFYGEVGAFLFPYTTGNSTHTYVFSGVPAHFGGEIYITDWLHVFINVDLVFSAHFGVFSLGLTGPFNGVEGGFIFLI